MRIDAADDLPDPTIDSGGVTWVDFAMLASFVLIVVCLMIWAAIS